MRKRLVELRKQKGKELGIRLTQEKVAAQLNISRSFYNMIETGDRNPPLLLAKKIADFFEVGVEEIFFHDEGSLSKEKRNRKR
ncbi:hypothetical protein DCMF_06935 [Candidatus Formimonas warabiya]|uniref:HTH cro/C1-type domain-containing protein n=1 Tax=Formimonas warabiya TaxID=1761012 RepID=A0A3G1L195_FORW1|nr:hypothetical protein DCMF_06935 [Candidatus Formimonas warabiya]